MPNILDNWNKAQHGLLTNYSDMIPASSFANSFKVALEDVTTTDSCADLRGIFSCKFGNRENVLAVAGESGTVLFYNGAEPLKDRHFRSNISYNNSITELCWSHDDENICTGTGDGRIDYWDVELGTQVNNFSRHCASVKTIRQHHRHRSIFVSGSRDGVIKLHDIRSCAENGAIRELAKPHALLSQTTPSRKKIEPAKQCGVTGALFLKSSEYLLVSSGSVDGKIKIWDMRFQALNRNKLEPVSSSQLNAETPKGISYIFQDSTGSQIFAISRDHSVYCLDINLNIRQRLHDTDLFSVGSFYVQGDICSNDRFIVTGSSFGHALLWDMKTGKASALHPDHSYLGKEVGGASFSRNTLMISSTSESQGVSLHRSKGFDNAD